MKYEIFLWGSWGSSYLLMYNEETKNVFTLTLYIPAMLKWLWTVFWQSKTIKSVGWTHLRSISHHKQSSQFTAQKLKFSIKDFFIFWAVMIDLVWKSVLYDRSPGFNHTVGGLLCKTAPSLHSKIKQDHYRYPYMRAPNPKNNRKPMYELAIYSVWRS